MNYEHSTFYFAGIEVDGYVQNGKPYATVTGFMEACGGSRENFNTWKKRHAKEVKGISVKAGKRNNVNTTAYEPSTLRQYLAYRISLGDKTALNIPLSSFEADLTRSILESNGHTVTAAQHEETRQRVFEALQLEQHMLEALENGVDFDELAQEQQEKSKLVQEMTPEEQQEYLKEYHRLNEESRQRRESKLKPWVQDCNQVIARM